MGHQRSPSQHGKKQRRHCTHHAQRHQAGHLFTPSPVRWPASCPAWCPPSPTNNHCPGLPAAGFCHPFRREQQCLSSSKRAFVKKTFPAGTRRTMTAQLLRPEIDPSKHARNAVQSKVSPGFTAMHGASGDCACHASFIAKPDKSVDAHAFQSTGVEDGRLLPK